jgi:integrase/recombinase XerD
MTPLRQRMQDAMVQRGFALRTQESYVGAIYRMAKHYRRDPAQYTAQEVQSYLLHMVTQDKLSYSSMNQAACAAQFLYQSVLGHAREQFHIPFAKVPAKQPEVLAREEIARLFAACANPVRRMLLQTIYASGLRVSEACALRVTDIDSASDRMCIRVACGKGGKGRYSILSPTLLELLRAYVRYQRPSIWLFNDASGAQPMRIEMAQRAYQSARTRAHISKAGGIHTLRHCFATHLLEGGVDLFTIQKLLGHGHISTTSQYLHLISPQLRVPKDIDPLDLLAGLPKA